MSLECTVIVSNRSLPLHAAAGLLCLNVACGNGAGPALTAPDGGPANAGSVGSGSSGGVSPGGGSSPDTADDAGAPSLASGEGAADGGDSDGSLTDGGDAGSRGDAAPDSGLDPSVAPGGNFDLSTWELEEPVGSPGAPTTIAPSLLVGASGYHDAYFFTDPTDGSMVFWDPENGVTTATSTYPSTVLRETTDEGVPASWTSSGTNTLSATVEATEIPDHVAVGQIHFGTGTASTKPLLQLYYYASGAIVIAVAEGPPGDAIVEHTLGNVPLGTRWSYAIGLAGSAIRVSIDGAAAQKFDASPRSRLERMYFRAGDLDQSIGDSGTVGGAVRFYALQVVHGP